MKIEKKKYPAIVWKEGDLYVAKLLEVELASQGSSKNEALENLQEALELLLEDEKRLILGNNYEQVKLQSI